MIAGGDVIQTLSTDVPATLTIGGTTTLMREAYISLLDGAIDCGNQVVTLTGGHIQLNDNMARALCWCRHSSDLTVTAANSLVLNHDLTMNGDVSFNR